MLGLRTTRQYATLPSLPSRGPLPPMVSVIIPLARTNLITNPSIELVTTGYTAVGGSIARSAVQQYHGTYSLAVTPSAGTNSDGAFYGTVSMTAGVPYAYSLKFKATGAGIGKPYALSIATTGSVDLAVTQFIATGRWQWITGVYGEATGAARRVYIRKMAHAAADIFYVDGWQVESCIDGILAPTTYIDGDQQGLLVGQQPPVYYWTAIPHASTSVRTELTRAGGYLVNLSTYNFLLTAILGLGLAAPNNISVPYTVLDGARYLRTTKPPRTLTLVGRFQADDWSTYQQGMSDFRQAVDRDLIPIQQPLLFQVEPQDECGNVIGDFAQIQCFYAGGLEGDDGNVPIADVAPTFTMYIPYIIGGDSGAPLTVQTSLVSTNFILQRTASGTWQKLGTGTDNLVVAMAYTQGKLFVGGSFLDAGGSGADYLASWDGTSWAVVGSATALNGAVNALAVGPDGALYVGGQFLDAGGVANADAIAKWDGAAWSALGTGANASVSDLAFDRAGNLYAIGGFTLAGGVANTVRIAKWNGSAWSALGTGLNNTGLALAVDARNNVYAGGSFTLAGGVANTVRIAKWNGSAWSALGTGVTGAISPAVNTIAIGPNGAVYIGGQFDTASGVAAKNIAVWNGSVWAQVGGGTDAVVSVLTFQRNGTLFVGGGFTTAGGIPLPDAAAYWNGSAWLPLDVNLPGSSTVFVAVQGPDGALAIGFSTNGTAVAAGNTTVTNTTPGIVYPRVVIKGPTSGTSAVYQLLNYTTGIGVWFNLTLSAGETATLIFDPQNPSFTSDFQGDLTGAILPGSLPALFYLALGNNNVSFFAASSTVVATISWQTHYNGLPDLVN